MEPARVLAIAVNPRTDAGWIHGTYAVRVFGPVISVYRIDGDRMLYLRCIVQSSIPVEFSEIQMCLPN